jgi:hypothetical protein
VTDGALGWLVGVGADEGFFLWVHYFDPHRPHEVPPRPLDRVPEDAVRGLVEERWEELEGFGAALADAVEDWRGYVR